MSAPSVTKATAGRSWIDAAGLAGRSRGVRLLTLALAVAALLISVAGPFLPLDRPPRRPLPVIAGIGLAVALAAAGQLARLPFPLGRGVVSVSWGETAFIIGFVVAPPGWMPAVTLVGAVLAWVVLSWLHEHRSVAEVAHLAASLSLGAAGATVVASLVAGNTPVISERMQFALVAGTLAYLVITFGLAVLTLSLHRDAPARQILLRV